MPDAAAGAWQPLALDPPRALPIPAVGGQLRAAPEDFQVEEVLGYAPDGGHAHRLLWVEKQGANTLDVASGLAAVAGCHPAEVGFAGMKDRRAVTRQWFSVPAERSRPPEAGFEGSGFRVLAAHAHSRKLRRGALAGNAFAIRLRDATGDLAGLPARIDALGTGGFPNYFGPQRFGTGGANLARVETWLARGWLPRGREARAFVLSTARALAFQAVLAQRVLDGSWSRLLPGEIVNLAGSASVFRADEPDAELDRRCREGDLGPTGPLPGEEGLCPAGAAGALERAALDPMRPIPERLAQAGLRGERRALIARPADLRHRLADRDLLLEFRLPRGCYATSLLRELVAGELPEDGAE